MEHVDGSGDGGGPDPVEVAMSYRIIIPTIYANPEMLDRLLEELEIAHVVSGGSFAQNCNKGAEGATEDILIFLNDDTLPHVGWLQPLLDTFSDPEVGIVGARLLYPDGRIQHAGVYFDAPGGVLTAHNILEDIESVDVDAVTGACLAIRRTLFEDCGGFDDQFDNGYEDVDLCLRVKAGGWRIRYCAESTLIHYESQSGAARWRSVGANVQRLQDLWNVRSD